MKTVTFVTGGFRKEVSVPDKSNLLRVIHDNDLFIDAPCAGNGTCGKCGVEIDGREVLACRVSVESDIAVRIPEYNNLTEEDTDVFRHIKEKDSIVPVIKRVVITIDLQSRANYISDVEYISGLLKEKGFNINPPSKTDIINKISAFTHTDGVITVYIFEDEIIDLTRRAGAGNYGLAIDVGTTSVSIALVDIETGGVTDAVSFYNPQIMYGADVINRIIYANKNDNGKILKTRLLDEIKESIGFLCLKNNVAHDEIKSACVSGNTTMMHLMLGVNPKYIREEPFSPVVRVFPVFDSAGTIDIIENGKIFIMPCASNYLGGDLTSGALACRMNESEGISILLDIGTNGEIIVGSRDWLMGCACSAGPAFEGMGLNCGTRYREGAIYSAEYAAGKFEYKIAGNVKPAGISGTGIISLIKILWENGYIDNRGKFTEKVTTIVGHKKAFILFDENETSNNGPIYINETDIDNILRAKAAIYSGINLILKQLSLDHSMIDKFYIAGGIGSALNLGNALKIGLLPPVERSKIKFAGNSSLIGAVEYLVLESARRSVAEIFGKLTYIDLSSEPAYMDEFMAALFIPHTDLDLFKNV